MIFSTYSFSSCNIMYIVGQIKSSQANFGPQALI